MPVEFRVPPLGESVAEATVASWLKHVGDVVEAGEPLVELETDKVNVDVAADRSGVLTRIVRGPGETVHPGDVLATVSDQAAAVTASGAGSGVGAGAEGSDGAVATPTEAGAHDAA